MNQKINTGKLDKKCGYNGGITVSSEATAVLNDAKEECVETRERRLCSFSDPVCVNTNQVYDSCRDRDCVQDQRVYLKEDDQCLIDRAINVKLKSAEVIWVYSDVEPLAFNDGYFSVDLKFFVLVTLEVFTGLCNPTIIRGLTTYDKRIVLYGSKGCTKVFTSRFDQNGQECILDTWQKKNMPTVTIEVAAPVALTAEIKESSCCSCSREYFEECDTCSKIIDDICDILGGSLSVDDTARQVLVTYGLFFIVRLERESQLLLDAVDFCIPTRECPGATEENPCELFNDIRFPIEEFFPPKKRNENTYDVKCPCGKKNCDCNR